MQKESKTCRRTFSRFIRSSSASLPPAVFDELKKIFKTTVIEAYGMTEATHQMTSNPMPPEKQKAGFVGKPAGPEVCIMDAQGNKLDSGVMEKYVSRR